MEVALNWNTQGTKLGDIGRGEFFKYSEKGPLFMRTNCTAVIITGDRAGEVVTSTDNLSDVHRVENVRITGDVNK